MPTIDIAALPVNDLRRNLPLGDVAAEYQLIGTKTWRLVRPAMPIAQVTFNDLGDVWTSFAFWRINDGD
jgi:hypothetical protein